MSMRCRANRYSRPSINAAAALSERFSSQGHAEFQNKLLSAMRYSFGGHVEQR
jgi:6-phosphogluconate dehydrogenase